MREFMPPCNDAGAGNKRLLARQGFLNEASPAFTGG